MNRLRNLRANADDGFTLIELMVTMLITGIVLAMAGAFFVNISRLTSWSGNDRAATGQAALALDAIRAIVRVAADNPTSATNTDPAVLVAKPTQLTLTAFSNTSVTAVAPSKVTLAIDAAGYLVVTRQAGTQTTGGYWVFTAAPVSSRVAGPFSLTPTTSFFTYLNTTGAVMSSPAGLTLAQRKTITFVRATTTVDGTNAGGASDPVVVTTSIGMPNLQRDVSATISIPDIPTPTATPVFTTPAVTPTPTRTTASATPTPTTGSGGSGTGSGTGSGSGTGTGTPRPTGTGGTGGGSTGGGSGTSTPAPTRTTASPTPTPTRTTATPTPTPTPTPTHTRVAG